MRQRRIEVPARLAPAHGFARRAYERMTTRYLLLGRRVHYRVLAPGAALTAIALTLVDYGSALVMPEMVASSSSQFGTIGVAFALLAWLTAVSMVVMGCAVVGAELAKAGWTEKSRPTRA